MKKTLLINLVLEGNEEIVNEIKSSILTGASVALKSCDVKEVQPQKFDIEVPAFISIPRKAQKGNNVIIDIIRRAEKQ